MVDEIQRQADRRQFLVQAAAAGVALASSGLWSGLFGSDAPTPADAAGAGGAAPIPGRPMAQFPEKSNLIILTDRPPNLETPISAFVDDLTPNEAFFVRWHLGVVPTSINTKTFRLAVGGNVQTPLSLSLDELKTQFEPASVVAVNQCSGNGRALFEPRVPGGQWENGAVGNAKWTGVKLSDLLKKAGIKAGSVDVTFGGLDKSPLPTVQPFVKSLPVDHPKVAEIVIAYAMNDAPLPMLNGFPLRVVVPGWYATYWVKALNEVNVTAEKFAGFWMAKAYRIPTTPNMIEQPGNLAKETVPINEMTCRSLVVKPLAHQKVPAGKPFELQGVAMDSGKGITKVEVSTDSGKTWVEAKLDGEIGKYSWRRFRHTWTPSAGVTNVMSRATNAAGETQTTEQWNRAGYGRNVIEAVPVMGV